jgi:hypothetical protein
MKNMKKLIASLALMTLGLTLLPAHVWAAKDPGGLPGGEMPMVDFGGGDDDDDDGVIEIGEAVLQTFEFSVEDLTDRVLDVYPIATDFGFTAGDSDGDESGPDLIISNIYRDETTDVLVVQMTNQGDEDVTVDTGHTYIWIDDMDSAAWTYSWSTLADQGFMEQGSTSVIMPQIIPDDDGDYGEEFSEEGHTIRACIDYFDRISETSEDNNCNEATILSNDDADDFDPDLEITDIYVDDDGKLTIEAANTGNEDVTDLSGKTYIWIDDMDDPAWTYSWSTLSDEAGLKDFMLAGNSSVIQPQTLFGGDDTTDATVMACVDYDADGDATDGIGVADEIHEDNNCRTAELVERVTRDFPDTTRQIVLEISEENEEPTGSPDLVVSDIYRDEGSEELVFHVTNQGDTDVSNSSGETHIWVDGGLVWSYDWNSLTDQNFMIAGETSAVRPQVEFGDSGDFTTGTHQVEVCVDYTNVETESNEDNNCDEAELFGAVEAETLYPDLKVENVYLQRGSNYLTIDMTNEGEEDVADLIGTTYIWVDDMSSPAWSYTWTHLSDENRTFLQVGETSTIQPEVLFGAAGDVTNATVMVCVDYDDVIEENDETDNCLTVTLGEQELPQTYDTSVEDAGVLMGATYDDNRVDFEGSRWTEWLHDSSSVIRERNRVAFDPNGDLEVDGNVKAAWLNEVGGWMDFSWCDLGADPTSCQNIKPAVDMNLEGSLAYTGDAYWTGRAYVSATSDWVQFGWNCSSMGGTCDAEDRVHTDLETGEISGYAWSSGLGWIDFGNTEEAQYITAQTLPEEVDTIYVQPVVTITPDPEEVTKYGQGGGQDAPVADGEESYSLNVKLVDVDTGDALTDEYDVSIEVTPTVDSHVYYDQIARTAGSDSAVFFGEVSYNTHSEKFTLPIYSHAPTSNVNGLDKDADGTIDYPFDQDPGDASGYTHSNDANTYVIDDITIEVSGGPSPVEFTEVGAGTAPLWNLNSDQVDLKFAPAIEVSNLGRWSDAEGSVVYSILNVANQEMPMTGLVAAWSEAVDFEELDFDVTATLNSGTYYYVFDNNNDGNYIANAVGGDDYARVHSGFNVFSMGWDTDVHQAFEDTGYYVPITSSVTAAGLGDGSSGDEIQNTMLVNEDGYTAPTAYQPSLFARLMDWLNPFGASLQANAAGSGSDLAITDIYLTGNSLKVVIENVGNEDVIPVGGSPHISIEIEDVKSFGYSHATLADTSFMDAGGSTTLSPHTLSEEGQYTVTSCADSNEQIVELDESNNCMTVEFDTRDLPDLIVDSVSRDNITGELVMSLQNIGTADAVPYLSDPFVYIYIDGVREWAESYTDVDDSFMEVGGVSEIRRTPTDEPAQYTLEVCVDARSAITESDETNNCLSSDITSETLYSDLMISAVYYDESVSELVIEQRNIGAGEAISTTGETRIWIDGAPERTFYWSSIDDSFMEVGGSAEIRYALADGNYSVQACIDYTGAVEEEDENNNCVFASIGSGADISPLYSTVITYTLPFGEDVAYYSSYMPLISGGGGEASGYNVPAYDQKLDADISGSVTSSEDIDEDTGIENVGGDLETKEIRNQLYSRFKLLTKGANPEGGGTITGEMETSDGASLMNDDILYFTGDVVLEDLGIDYEEVTIGVIGGDVYVDSNLLGESIGVLIFRDSDGNGGNMHIHPSVTDVKMHVFADGGIYSYDGDRDSVTQPDYLGYNDVRSDWDYNTRLVTLNNQLAWYGSMVADITITGASDVSNMFLPDNEETNDRLLASESCLMDLREFVLCWQQTGPSGEGLDMDGDGDTDYDDMEECEDAERATTVDFTGVMADDNHSPVIFEYEPPSDNLPVFSRTS